MLSNFVAKIVPYVNVEKNITPPDMPRMTVWRVRITCWIIKATNAHSEYVILSCFFHCSSGCTNWPQRYVTLNIAYLVSLEN
jgi:hypothetical protein